MTWGEGGREGGREEGREGGRERGWVGREKERASGAGRPGLEPCGKSAIDLMCAAPEGRIRPRCWRRVKRHLIHATCQSGTYLNQAVACYPASAASLPFSRQYCSYPKEQPESRHMEPTRKSQGCKCAHLKHAWPPGMWNLLGGAKASSGPCLCADAGQAAVCRPTAPDNVSMPTTGKLLLWCQLARPKRTWEGG